MAQAHEFEGLEIKPSIAATAIAFCVTWPQVNAAAELIHVYAGPTLSAMYVNSHLPKDARGCSAWKASKRGARFSFREVTSPCRCSARHMSAHVSPMHAFEIEQGLEPHDIRLKGLTRDPQGIETLSICARGWLAGAMMV